MHSVYTGISFLCMKTKLQYSMVYIGYIFLFKCCTSTLHTTVGYIDYEVTDMMNCRMGGESMEVYEWEEERWKICRMT